MESAARMAAIQLWPLSPLLEVAVEQPGQLMVKLAVLEEVQADTTLREPGARGQAARATQVEAQSTPRGAVTQLAAAVGLAVQVVMPITLL